MTCAKAVMRDYTETVLNICTVNVYSFCPVTHLGRQSFKNVILMNYWPNLESERYSYSARKVPSGWMRDEM